MSYLYSNVLVRDLAADVNLVSLSNDCPRGQGQDHGELTPHSVGVTLPLPMIKILRFKVESHEELKAPYLKVLLTRTAYHKCQSTCENGLLVMCQGDQIENVATVSVCAKVYLSPNP